MIKIIRDFIKEMEVYNKIFAVIYIGFIVSLLVLFTPKVLFNQLEIEQQEYHNVTVEVIGKRMNGKLGKYLTINRLSNKCYNSHCGLPKDGEYFISKINFISIEGKVFIHYFCLKESQRCIYNINEDFIEKQKIDYLRNGKFVVVGFLMAFGLSLFISFLGFKQRKLKK